MSLTSSAETAESPPVCFKQRVVVGEGREVVEGDHIRVRLTGTDPHDGAQVGEPGITSGQRHLLDLGATRKPSATTASVAPVRRSRSTTPGPFRRR